ncbi:MAG: hypothetical protein Q7U50_10990, partial [Candidatus Nitrotoga sp.]|nr:hypothetical protein [Candidatus Nitrotoga sp.]MDP3496703.1 hypothetical protein [Candidatus Nitrotoga sp.]
MSRYRRAMAAGSSYFFTVVAYRRQSILCDEAIRNALRASIVRNKWGQTLRSPHKTPLHFNKLGRTVRTKTAHARQVICLFRSVQTAKENPP